MKSNAKMKEYGHLADAIGKMPNKPKFSVTARVDNLPNVEDDNGYHKEAADRLRKEIKACEDQLEKWDHEEVGKQAHKSLSRDLAAKRARLLEHESYMDESELDDDMEEGGKKKGYASVGEKGKGAVVGGPYEIVAEGGKFKVKNMDKNTVKGTFDSRKDALKQFRLLEMIEHGKKPRSK